jgi:hypothetical protein
MHTTIGKTLFRGIGAALLTTTLASCGGSFTTVTAGGGGGPTSSTPSYQMGNGSGATGFQAGKISIATSSLSAGGSTTLTVSIVDANSANALVTSIPTSIAFTSTCANNGSGPPLATLTTPVVTSGGQATSTYTAQGCVGNDNITATAVVAGNTLSATGSVTVAAPVPVPEMGNGFGNAFVNQALAAQVTSLSAGGSTTLTANIVDANNGKIPYNQAVTVNFISQCISAGQATITSPVSTSNGTATATYTAKGCSGNDVVTASATAGTASLTATVTLTIQPPTLGSINFVSASPTSIALKGMGGAGQQETSAVVFVVKDSTGGVIANKTVNFTLSTSVGGISLSPTTVQSDANGLAQTNVQSGTVATPVSVTATVAGTSNPVIQTTSGQLTIHSGIPTQLSFSAGPAKLNVQAFNHDGVTDAITVFLADRFGNPVPDGTPVTFVDRGPGAGGSVGPSCSTVNGTCTVNWTSQNPRPTTTALSKVGRAHILVYAVGEESFLDNNGDGVFDTGDTFTDIGEIFSDSQETGTYASGETFFDFDQNNTYTFADNKWEGVNCQDPTRCGTASSTGVGKDICIVMSTDGAIISTTPQGGGTFTNGQSTTLTVGTGKDITFSVTDANGNAPTSGTTVALVQSNVANVTITAVGLPSTLADFGCGAGAITFSVHVAPTAGATSPPVGALQLTVTTPGPATISGGAVVNLQ